MSGDLAAARRKAWETRRAKYGPRGHAGSYDRSPGSGFGQGMIALLVQLHREGVLSEGQVRRATGLDRVTIRAMADNQEVSHVG